MFLLFLFFDLIVCISHLQINCDNDEALARNGRSSYIDSNHYRPDNLYRLPEAKYDDKEEFKAKDVQLSAAEVDARIKNVFVLTSEPHLSSFSGSSVIVSKSEARFNSYQMHGDQSKPLARSTTDPFTSNLMNVFKVQRNPDGKLSFAYDKFLPLQPTANTDSKAAYTRNRDSPILFPTDEPNTKSPFSVDVAECLEQGKTFCTKIRNYPKLGHLENILKREFPNVELFFGVDKDVPDNITQRMNVPFEDSLCKSHEKIIYPEAAESESSNWSYIVNNPNFKQGIRIEECENEGSQCNSMLSLPKDYYATCKQNFIFRSLVALTPDGKLINDHFKMPSCCKCVINCDTDDETLTKDDGEEELQTRNPQLSRTYRHQRHRRHISPDEIDATIRKVFNLSSEPLSSSFSGSSIIVSNSEAHFNSYRDVMHGDEPKPLVRPTTDPFTSNLMNIFKVQRNPDGKLSFAYEKFLPLQPTANTDLIPVYSRNRDSPLLFPANEPNKGSPFSVDVAECLEQGKTFCTKVRNYPKLGHLEDILKREFPNVELFFGEDIEVPQRIMPHIDIEPFEEFLCKSHEKVIYPEAAESKNSNWSYIVNDANFKQGIRIEECENEGSQCNSMLSLPRGYYATCKQNFIFRSLVALTPEGKLITDHFKMPSCCKCVITQIKN
uniref:Spaetzle domain-containing protein n=1 Tax=Glossina austeni TaxID=7395 RepID=A0A1A9UTI1_GLOAU